MFIEIIKGILTDQAEIKGLPQDKLIAMDHPGELVPGNLSHFDVVMIARLQTLIALEQERGEMPSHDMLDSSSKNQKKAYAELAADSLCIQEDLTRRIMLLEQLIIEIVREAIPAECERFDAVYFLTSKMRLRRRPMPQRRFLD